MQSEMSVLKTNLTPVKIITEKVIISGNVVERFTYEHPYIKGGQCNNEFGRKGNGEEITVESQTANREKVLNRARSRVRRLVNANPQCNKFLTLTFKENIKDLRKANGEFKKFISRLNYYARKVQFTHKIQYIAVVEFQKRGAIHYHILLNMPYIPIKELCKIWGNGFVYVNCIDNVDNVGAYVTKYMTKDHNDERLIGNRSFFTSQGLNEPLVEFHSHFLEMMKNSLTIVREFSKEFNNEELGKITYEQYIFAKEEPTRLQI